MIADLYLNVGINNAESLRAWLQSVISPSNQTGYERQESLQNKLRTFVSMMKQANLRARTHDYVFTFLCVVLGFFSDIFITPVTCRRWDAIRNRFRKVYRPSCYIYIYIYHDCDDDDDYEHVYMYIYIYIYTYTHIYVYIYTYMRVCVYVCMHACMYECMHACR